MGEAPTKISHNGNGAGKRVVELRDAIARKRDQISVELKELKRRRADAMVKAKNGALIAGAGLLGFMIVGSLVHAVRDLFQPEEEEENVKVLVEKEKEEDRSLMAIVLSAALSIAINELRGYAIGVARQKFRERLAAK